MATHIKTVARASLFDRLIDLNPAVPEESQPLRALDLPELKESVRWELERVLNTRCPSPAHLLDEQGRTILDYGMPDMSALCPQHSGDQRLLTQLLAQTIERFEPRLRQVRVELEPLMDASPHTLWVNIDAILVIESTTEPVSFPALIQSKSGEASVYVNE